MQGVDGQDVLVRGIIDQVAMDEAGALQFTELKTRRSRSLPRAAQLRGAGLQIRLYRHLFRHFSGALVGALQACASLSSQA